jgi:LacI family transcriptional regulator
VTLESLAQATSLGRTTISDILNGKNLSRYAESTRQRVQEAAEQLGYSPSHAARQLARGRSGMVGLMLTRGLSNPYWGRLVQVLERRMHEVGYRLQLGVAEGDPEAEARHLRQLESDGVEALIVGPVYELSDLEQHRQYCRGQLPIFVFGAPIAGYQAVGPDHYHGARLAVNHLLANGHRRIGYLCSPDADLAHPVSERLLGIRDGLVEADCYEPSQIATLPDSGEFEQMRVAALRFGRGWLHQSPSERVTAVICHNDQYAMTTLEAFYELGIRVPDDISLIGFDNLPESRYFVPPLTTVDGHLDEQIERLLAMVMSGLNPVQENYASKVIAPTLVQRQSIRDIGDAP